MLNVPSLMITSLMLKITLKDTANQRTKELNSIALYKLLNSRFRNSRLFIRITNKNSTPTSVNLTKILNNKSNISIVENKIIEMKKMKWIEIILILQLNSIKSWQGEHKSSMISMMLCIMILLYKERTWGLSLLLSMLIWKIDLMLKTRE